MKNFNLRMPEEVHKWIKEESSTYKSMNSIIVEAILKYKKEKEKGE